MLKKELYKFYRDLGWSYSKIGKYFGVSKQAVHGSLGYIRKDRVYKYRYGALGYIQKDRVYKYGEKIFASGGLGYLREAIRIRDKRTCQKCGKAWIMGMRRFDVHHLDEKLENNRSCAASKAPNKMITLCHKCHLSLPHIRKKMSMKLKQYYALPSLAKT